MASLSSRKNWEIFAFPIENIDYFIFAYSIFRGHLKKVICKEVTSELVQIFFLHFPWSYLKFSEERILK